LRRSKENFLQFGKPFGKIGKNFGSNFTFVASRTKDARHQDPSWSVGVQRSFEDFDAKAATAQADAGNSSLSLRESRV
jgi:hypothetical protein